MLIKITISTPMPNMYATKPKNYMAGPADEVARGKFEIDGNLAQDEVIDRLRDGYVIVGKDELGFIATMHMSYKGRLVEMQDGFSTAHVVVLMRELGYCFATDPVKAA